MRPLVLAVLLFLVGCTAPLTHVLGTAPADLPGTSVRRIHAERPSAVVQLTGTMVEKCPTAGCWFRLKDETGTLFVDLKGAGLTIADLPVGTPIVVAGKVVNDGDELRLHATGLRY